MTAQLQITRGSVSAQESSSQPKVQQRLARKQHKSQVENPSKLDAMEHEADESCKEIERLEHVHERNPALQSRDGRKRREEERSSKLSAK